VGILTNLKSEDDKNIQEGFFKDGERIGWFRILTDKGKRINAFFHDNQI